MAERAARPVARRNVVGAMIHKPRRSPTRWLLSDPLRLPDPGPLLARLPRGSVVLLRDATGEVARRVARACRQRGLRLMLAGDGRAALAAGAGLHVPDRRPCHGLLPFLLARRGQWLSCAVHGRAGVARARRLRADAVLVSPAFPTASHPGAPALGPCRWAALARAAGRPAVALGGVTPGTARRLSRLWLRGLAGIGMWSPRHSVSGKSQGGPEGHCPRAQARSIVRAGPG